MANCDLCKQKIPFMGGETFLVGKRVQNVSVGDTYTLCAKCMELIRKSMIPNKAAKDQLMVLIGTNIEDEEKRENFFDFLDIDYDDMNSIQKHIDEKKEQDECIKKSQEEEIQRFLSESKDMRKRFPMVFDLNGSRGRSMQVYTNRVVIKTSITVGSILSENATDGEKTIFFHDVIGIQYKEPGITTGYIQLETASGQMNNLDSNAFNENTFTFTSNVETMNLVKDYIIWQVSKYKNI